MFAVNEETEENDERQKTIVDELLGGSSFTTNFGNEISPFIRSTADVDRAADPLRWFCSNEKRFSNIGEKSRDVISIK